MKILKYFVAILMFLVLGLVVSGKIRAVSPTIEASLSATPTEASLSATPLPTEIKPKENITEPSSPEVKYRLESVLDRQQIDGWNGVNSMRKVVRVAINRGVSANTIVLLLLLPLVATLVSVLHYVFGLTGYGIFMPTMLAVTFLATGIFGGLLLFAMILAISLAGSMMLRKLKLHFWPSRSINLTFIAFGTFGLMFVSSFIPFVDISNISIFPILFMILLAEEFVRTQLVKSRDEAMKLTLGTLIVAIGGAVTMNFRWIQEMVLLYPEITLLTVIVINIIVGNYTGIRLLEIKRFRKAVRE
ncbi:MAG: 7TM domain-containing protein [Patescibacteria group bacterium]|jgi:hypothetical protein